MNSHPEHQNNLLLKGVITGVVAIALIGGLLEIQNSSKQSTPTKPGSSPSLVGDLPTPLPTQTLRAESPFPTSTYKSGDRQNPYYPFTIYPVAPAPAGYASWDCFSIPAGGTSFGAILVGGESTFTRYDTPNAAVFVNGVNEPPVLIDTKTDPKTWHAVELVQPETVACSH